MKTKTYTYTCFCATLLNLKFNTSKIIPFRKSAGTSVAKTGDKTILTNRAATSDKQVDKEEDNEDSIRAAPNGQTQEVPGSLEENDIVQQQESDGGRKRDDKV